MAQLVEHRTLILKIQGSSPLMATRQLDLISSNLDLTPDAGFIVSAVVEVTMVLNLVQLVDLTIN